MIYGLFLSFTSYAAFAISDAFVKMLDGAIPPYEVVFYGALFSVIVIPFVKKPDEQWRDVVVSRNWPLWFLRGGAGVIGAIGSVMAFTYLSMAEAFTLIFLQPVFVSILSMVFLHEHVGWRRWLAIVIGFLGVIVILRPGFRALSIGHLGAALAGLSGAITIMLFRSMAAYEKRITLYASGVIGPLIICGILAFFHYTPPQNAQWFYLAGYGLLAALASLLAMAAARLVPAILIAIPQYSQMLWAIGFGYILFHDSLDIPTAVGIVLIIASSILTFVREEKRHVTLPRSAVPTETGLAQYESESQQADDAQQK